MDQAGETNKYATTVVSSIDKSLDRDSPRGGDRDHDLYHTTGLASSTTAIHKALRLIRSEDVEYRLFAAREIRRLTKTSQRCRRLLSDAVEPLVSMLRYDSPESHHEAALLALLNLSVKDEKNKVKIIEAGALEPINTFLQSDSPTLHEYAVASLLTLSASQINKPIIGTYGTIPHLIKHLSHGSSQCKIDSVMTLSNLSTVTNNLNIMSETKPVPLVITLLKSSKKSSKTAEKCCSLIESLAGSSETRKALTSNEGGVFALVEVLENGTLQGREHAIGTLLTLCQSDRSKYREPILREGVIPSLLELTVQGTPKSQTKAKRLLYLLRDSGNSRSEFKPDALENLVSDIVSHIDGDDQCNKAKKMLADMVQGSMEKSLRNLQERASVVLKKPILSQSRTMLHIVPSK